MQGDSSSIPSPGRRFLKRWNVLGGCVLALALVLSGVFIAFARSNAVNAAHPILHQSNTPSGNASGGSDPSSTDWSTYMFNSARSGYNSLETTINANSAASLKLHWRAKTGGPIFSQPVVVKGLIYAGTFQGNEVAMDLTGKIIWQQNLGAIITCTPAKPLGVVSTAAIATVTIHGTPTSVDFVGGGDHNLYALNALTGAILWHTLLGAAGRNIFIWDSPLVVNNSVYIGTATTGEGVGCPLVPGQVFQLNSATGIIQHIYNSVPPTCGGGNGGGIWSSLTYDATDNSIYFTTGTQGTCGSDTISIGIVKLSATNLAYVSSWDIPHNQRLTNDADFASTPTLFTATINGTVRHLVGAVDKNGVYYAFDRTALSSGPVWSTIIAVPGACPQCGQGSISSSVWDGNQLYVAGGNTTINGTACIGSLRALNPADGTIIWQTCLPNTVLGALTVVPGVVALVSTPYLIFASTLSGAILFQSTDPTHIQYYGSPTIVNGVVYVGSTSGKVSAWGL